ncbi:S24 family peptidase [Aliarcobacter lanthieri]|uniref:S24 family peptidase n=1 Tax=Aliarcobacter lanthieri TaxID=1355374 RepID=UPI003AAFA7BB
MEISKVEELMNIEPVTTKAELARHLDVTPQSFSNWFSRNNIPEKYVIDLASFFTKKLNKNISETYLLNSRVNEKPVQYVPIIGTASCGGCDINHLQESDKKAYYNGDFWKPTLYCVIANGDSMSPEIDDGDEVIIDPDVKCQHGDMVYYKIDEESAIKVLVIDKEAHIMQFVPYNSNEKFKTKTIRLDDDELISKLTYHKVVSVNKLKFNNRAARLKLIGR